MLVIHEIAFQSLDYSRSNKSFTKKKSSLWFFNFSFKKLKTSTWIHQENEKYAGEARSRLQPNRLLLSSVSRARSPRVAQLIMYCSSEYCILFEFYYFLAAFNKKGCRLVFSTRQVFSMKLKNNKNYLQNRRLG